MLRDKGIKSIEEIQKDFQPDGFDIEKLTGIFKAMKLTASFSEFSHFKKGGFSFQFVLSLLIVMVITAKKTVSSSLSILYEHSIHIGKDVFYRLKNNEHICWRQILWHIGMKFIQVTGFNNSTSETKPRYLIFDVSRLASEDGKIDIGDTLVKKSSSR